MTLFVETKSIFKKILFYALIIFLCILIISPVYILAKVSFSLPKDVSTQHPSFLLTNPTLNNWKAVFASGNIFKPLTKSIVVATSTALVAIIIVTPAAYVISRMGKKLKYTFILGLFFTRMFPTVGIALPISVTFLKMGLLDTYRGLVLANLIGQVPFMAWILVSTFESIPVDLEEAASIDGATRIKTLLQVILPVSVQGIAVATMYVWLNAWNEFTFARYLTLTENTMPLQIYYYVNRGGLIDQATYSAVLAVPVIIITFFLQRYLKGGNLSGAVKG